MRKSGLTFRVIHAYLPHVDTRTWHVIASDGRRFSSHVERKVAERQAATFARQRNPQPKRALPVRPPEERTHRLRKKVREQGGGYSRVDERTSSQSIRTISGGLPTLGKRR